MLEPQQERSRRSRDALIDAAAELVAEQGFESVTVRDVCARAGLTTGAFYARFSKKDDLALALVERLRDASIDITGAVARRAEVDGFSAAARELLERSLDQYRREGGLLRAVIAVARTRPEVAAAMRAINDEVFGVVLEALNRQLGTSDGRALSLGLFTVLNALREMILDQHLFEEEPVPISDDALVDELLRMLEAYLGVD